MCDTVLPQAAHGVRCRSYSGQYDARGRCDLGRISAHVRFRTKTFKSELQKTETDEQGNSEIALELQRYAQATYQLHVLANAFEPEGGRSVAAEAQARPGGYYWWRGACYYRYPNGAWSPPMGPNYCGY